jgi:hypothetical protein
MVESSWPASVVTQVHLQNLMSQGYMTVTELATCRVPEDPAPLGDTSWHAWCSMSEDLVCLHIDFSTCYCSSTTWSYIT